MKHKVGRHTFPPSSKQQPAIGGPAAMLGRADAATPHATRAAAAQHQAADRYRSAGWTCAKLGSIALRLALNALHSPASDRGCIVTSERRSNPTIAASTSSPTSMTLGIS